MMVNTNIYIADMHRNKIPTYKTKDTTATEIKGIDCLVYIADRWTNESGRILDKPWD